jgi:2-polyprenyl-3-methyl-5-hydroxy-6-metoxy-1,4-benzoquinol methylase
MDKRRRTAPSVTRAIFIDTGCSDGSGGNVDDQPAPIERQSADKSWNEYWSEFGEAAFANPANLYRERLILRHLGAPGRGARILDIGSGQGELILRLSERFPDAEYRGIEYSESGVRRSRRMAAQVGVPVQFAQRDLLHAADVDSSERAWATHAVCSEVLEHVDEPWVLLQNAGTYLAPGCRVVITVPAGPRSAFDRSIGHRRHFTPTRLRSVLEAAGLTVERIDRAGFPFFNLYRISVIARGRRLVGDVSGGDGGPQSQVARLALRGFDLSFRANIPRSPLGWQLVAVAQLAA